MKTKKLLLIVAVALCGTALFAQPKNVIKLNLPSLMYTSFDLQYERAIGGTGAVQLAVNWRPDGPIPMTKKLGLTDGPFAKITTSWLTITPELRLYTSTKKDAPKGFYFILPYIRYSKLNLKGVFDLDIPMPVLNSAGLPVLDANNQPIINNDPTTITMKGGLALLGTGAGFGSHWMIKDKVSIDVTWLGLEYYFSNKFTASVESNDPAWTTLIKYAGPALVDELKSIDGITTKISSTKIEASSKVRGIPFVRFGFALGYAF